MLGSRDLRRSVKHRLFLSDPACKQVLMLRTLALALVFGTTVLFGSLYAYATDHDESTGNGIDLSGVGHCSGRTLNVTSAWSWTQYPSSPSVTEVSEVPEGFVGKNAIVWTGEGTFDEFVVRGVDGMLVTADRDVDIRGSCHFTMDAAPGSVDTPCTTDNDCVGMLNCRKGLNVCLFPQM
jgi:hypothetical protein